MTIRRTLRALTLLLASMGAVATATAGAATPGEITTYPSASQCLTEDMAPAVGAGVVVRDCGGGAAANLLPDGLLVPLTASEFPSGPTVFGPAGEAWIGTEEGEYPTRGPVIVRVAGDGSIQRFPIPVAETALPYERKELVVTGLAIGAEGDLWAAIGEGGTGRPYYSSIGGELMRITPAGEVTFFPVPEGIEPSALALGPDGNLWFTGLQGFYAGEHSSSYGVGWIGRMTPTGTLDLFPTPTKAAVPSAIAASPDGVLWYSESSSGDIGTIHPDGQPGRRYLVEALLPQGLVFGPEGDAWITSAATLTRVTPAGQRTRFPVYAGPLAVGREGDIWVGGWKRVTRVVPGAPGLDLLGLRAERRARTVAVKVACGGSSRGCKGALDLTLEIPGHRHGAVGIDKRPHFRFGRTPYSVPAESQGTVRLKVPPRAIALAADFPGETRIPGRGLVVRATVAGGPLMSRHVAARSLLEPGRR